ncbi:MAG TPA: hypothetical protein VGD01_14835 [Candidatus Elarobacter sp.]|jgi:hypothetical protein
MRIALSGLAVLALAATSVSAAIGATPGSMSGGMMKSAMMPKCTASSGPVVWYMAPAKKFYMKGAAQYGKGTGKYVCRATAMTGGGKPGMAGSMGHGAMGGRSSGGSSMGGASSSGGSSMGGSSGGQMGTPSTPMTMAPKPIISPMPGGSMSPAIPGSTNAAPGSRGSPMPSASGSMGNASGNQGNTGAPGAGGQVPNNPASSSNSASPAPSSSPRPR